MEEAKLRWLLNAFQGNTKDIEYLIAYVPQLPYQL